MPPTSSCRVLRTLRDIPKASDGRASPTALRCGKPPPRSFVSHIGRARQHVGISGPRSPTALQCGKPPERSSVREGRNRVATNVRMEPRPSLLGLARLFAVKLASPLASLLDPRRLSLRTTAAKPQPSLGGRPEKRRFWHQSLLVFRPPRNDSANRAAKPPP